MPLRRQSPLRLCLKRGPTIVGEVDAAHNRSKEEAAHNRSEEEAAHNRSEEEAAHGIHGITRNHMRPEMDAQHQNTRKITEPHETGTEGSRSETKTNGCAASKYTE